MLGTLWVYSDIISMNTKFIEEAFQLLPSLFAKVSGLPEPIFIFLFFILLCIFGIVSPAEMKLIMKRGVIFWSSP